MKAAERVRFVFFDHGGTLAWLKKDTPQIVREVLSESGQSFSLEQVSEAVEKADGYWREKYRSLPRGQRFGLQIVVDYNTQILRHLGVEQGVDRVAKTLALEWHDRAGITVYPDTVPCLEGLRQRGLPIGVITQTLRTEEEFRRLHLSREGIEHYFSVIVTTESLGYDKPDVHLYRKAAELTGYAPREIMHVGDSYELDVRGARSAGMRAVLLDRRGDASRRDCETISSLLQLPQLVS